MEKLNCDLCGQEWEGDELEYHDDWDGNGNPCNACPNCLSVFN
jgi:hypothetical protein